jgi:tRNA(Ile)-lysidine synthase
VPPEPQPVLDFTDQMRVCLPDETPKSLGVAVSGGGDSTALLVMLSDWAKPLGVTLNAATVNHGLRPEALDEAEQVARLCAALNVSHTVLHWTGWDGKGNLQDQARRARHGLLAKWAKSLDLAVVALGHTSEDQAETLVMRLMRGSGVDGLAAMPIVSQRSEIRWIRPLLGAAREELRNFLRVRGIAWSEDPSNQNDAFERIHIRKAIEGLGLSVQGLANTAARMQETRRFLERMTQQAARSLATITPAGDITISRDGFFQLDTELQNRLLSHSLKWVASADYRPRFDSLRNLLIKLENGEKSTLAGCVITPNRNATFTVSREYAQVGDLVTVPSAAWDHRWVLTGGPETTGVTIRATGENGLLACPDWRAMGLPRTSLIAAPSVWHDSQLIAAPLAGWPQGWSISLRKGAEDYFSSILSH